MDGIFLVMIEGKKVIENLCVFSRNRDFKFRFSKFYQVTQGVSLSAPDFFQIDNECPVYP